MFLRRLNAALAKAPFATNSVLAALIIGCGDAAAQPLANANP